MAVDEQGGDEAGQRALLADDDLADLLADGQDGGPRIGGGWGGSMEDLLVDGCDGASDGDELVVGGDTA